jgi:hypothetical protein
VRHPPPPHNNAIRRLAWSLWSREPFWARQFFCSFFGDRLALGRCQRIDGAQPVVLIPPRGLAFAKPEQISSFANCVVVECLGCHGSVLGFIMCGVILMNGSVNIPENAAPAQTPGSMGSGLLHGRIALFYGVRCVGRRSMPKLLFLRQNHSQPICCNCGTASLALRSPLQPPSRSTMPIGSYTRRASR